MNVGDTLLLGGFITLRKVVMGQSLVELEKRLGFQKGRLSRGIYIAALADGQPLPCAADFDLRGYSQVADHRWNANNLQGYNLERLKQLAMQVWEPTGPNSLIKILPVMPHQDDIHSDVQYPPGSGVPQWKLTKRLNFRIIGSVFDYPEGKWSGR